MVPEAKFAIIVFYNSTAEVPDNVGRYALDQFFGLSSTPYPVVTTDPSSWGVYSGTYLDSQPSGYPQSNEPEPAGLGEIDVHQNGQALLVDIPGAGVTNATLTQIAGDAFYFTIGGSNLDVTFYRDGSDSDAGAPWFVTRSGVGIRQP
jgi:hypothetical protein